jgi:hypothetical protein
MKLLVGDKVIDSNLISGVFDWNTYGADGRLDLTLGHQDLRPVLQRAVLTIYDATYTEGLVWDELMIDVIKL